MILPHNTEEIKKKTKVPVFICVTCAIICIIAVILILFFCNKKNSSLKNSSVNESNSIAQNTENASDTNLANNNSTTDNEETKHPALENEIVVAPAEEIIPVEPQKETKAKENVTYKIKWGDTLWDLAKSYYNNPWKYPVIAKYNNIKNPDKIISGKTIIIPFE